MPLGGKVHYYKFNIADYRKDTAHLKPIEHYIYRQLIDWHYLDEHPIPLEIQSVMRRLQLETEQEPMLLNVLNDFFIQSEDGWIQERVMLEINEYKLMADKNKVNGRKGGRPKNQQLREEKNPVGSESDASGNSNHKPLTTNHKPIKTKGRFSPPSVEEIKSYCLERSNNINPETFIDHYTSNGWLVGKNKMKDWKAAVRTWEKRNGTNQQDTRSRAKRVSDELDRIAKEDIEENGFTEFLD